MTAGQSLPIYAEFGWHIAGITKDFGLVALGEEGELTLTHNDDIESDKWPGADLEETIPGSTHTPPEIELPIDQDDFVYRIN